jgi:predicted dehydrogenase
MTKRLIGVGVIGCGEIAQLMHLPFIAELPRFRLAALCDISAGTVAALGDQYNVAARYTDYRELLADPDVDAVVICTYDHAPVAAAAIAAGKHLIVEKPLAFTPEEAGPLVEAAAKKGVVALVGYMKLFDEGYERGRKQVAAIGRPRTIKVHDLAGRFDRYQRLYTQVRVADVPASVLEAGRAEIGKRIEKALGSSHAGYRDLYTTLLMLGSHDLAAMRGIFGSPGRVEYARPVGASQLLAVVEYEGGVPCIIEIGFGTQYEWWDEWIAVYGEREEVRIEFPHPYVRFTAATVRIREAADAVPAEKVIPGSPDTAFRREWQHFADCIDNGTPPRSPLAGGLADLDLAVAIIRAMPERRA